MMQALFTPEHEAFRASVRAFVERELAPHGLTWDRAGTFPREVFKRAGELGYLGIRHPVAWGGSGLDVGYVIVLVEELSRARNAGVGLALLVQAEMATPVIGALGTDEQKRLFLEPALRGEKVAALAITEPGCGSDVAALRTSARTEGDELVIDGEKSFITNGARADFLTLAVRTGGPGHEGISLVTFPTDVRGFSVSGTLRKLGNHSSDTAMLSFDACRIPRRFLLGEENAGFRLIMSNFQSERLVGALSAVAAAQRMLEDALAYGREREAFGRPIVAFQVWRHKFAEHLTALEAGRQLSYHAASRFEQASRAGAPPPVREISMAKLFTTDLAQRIAYDCMQLFGGAGYLEETPIARAFRDVRLLTIGGGTSEVMKEIVAKLEGL